MKKGPDTGILSTGVMQGFQTAIEDPNSEFVLCEADHCETGAVINRLTGEVTICEKCLGWGYTRK